MGSEIKTIFYLNNTPPSLTKCVYDPHEGNYKILINEIKELTK